MIRPATPADTARIFEIRDSVRANWLTNPDAVTACVARARENARGVREQISSEMWEHLNRLHLLVSRTRPTAVLASPHEFFARIRDAITPRTSPLPKVRLAPRSVLRACP